MSDRPAEQRPSGHLIRSISSDQQPSRNIAPSSSDVPPNRGAGAEFASSEPQSQQQPQTVGRGFELPPLPQMHGQPGRAFSPRTTRLSGVSSILNPIQPEETHAGQRRKAAHLDSPAHSAQPLPPIAAQFPGHRESTTYPAQSPIEQYANPMERQQRRVLTPRSPSMPRRAASVSHQPPQFPTISAQQQPFPPSPRSRAYGMEPGVGGVPPLPSPTMAPRNRHTLPAPPPSMEARRRASMEPRRPQRPSSSGSPETSYSEYSQTERTSPATQYATRAGGGEGSGQYATAGSEQQGGMGIPISSSGGQNVYQMMTLETTSGTVQLPVDVQAASRVADEKRRRNAGASARFRQRRKEKEKEASTTIGRLEQQVKELGEDADFYRRERDVISGILLHMPGGKQHFPRPGSPRRRRSSAMSMSSAGGGRKQSAFHEAQMHSQEHERNVRRRTSGFDLPPPPPPQPQPPPGHQPSHRQQQYGPPMGHQPPSVPPQHQPLGPLPSPMSRGALPAPSQGAPGPQQPQQQQPPHMLQPQPPPRTWNPYASAPPGPRPPEKR